ncbi:MAG: DUF664 domain-containing protein [Acidobacteria bacterium]|nr:DUF664 domain-containing protein [Acidobacteriota bacterium]
MSDLTELLERFRRGPEVLANVLTGAAGEELDYTPAAGKWSIRQIVAHVADAEVAGAWRFRMVIAEKDPVLQAMDENAWARSLNYGQRRLAQSLESFRRLRGENYELLKGLPASAWERAGTHTERGRITLRQLLETYADHAEGHARQVAAVRDQHRRERGRK